MLRFLLICTILLAYLAKCQEVDEKDVVLVDASTYDKAISDNKYLLVEAVATWCGHCKNLKPEFASAATKIKGVNDKVAFGKLECNTSPENTKRCQDLNVNMYPTILWYENGEFVSEYSRSLPRDRTTISKYVLTRTNPELIEKSKTDCEALRAEISVNKLASVYYGPMEGVLLDSYLKLNDPDGGVAFLENHNEKCA